MRYSRSAFARPARRFPEVSKGCLELGPCIIVADVTQYKNNKMESISTNLPELPIASLEQVILIINYVGIADN
jgi:hypothetical protein